MKSLVLVVGAGASKELNLPLGNELKSIISELLDIRYEHGIRQVSGDHIINDALKLLAQEDKANKQNVINDHLHHCWTIRDAMPLAMSIDHFIDAHSSTPFIAQAGKLAIARAILQAESNSTLAVDHSNVNNTIDFNATSKTWLGGFFQILTENCQLGSLPARLGSVAIINFNYDRCIEHFLFHAIRQYYKVTEAIAVEVLQTLEIYHPYGMVGDLPIISGNDGTAFGGDPQSRQLIALTDKLRTFTEGVDSESSNIERIREIIANCKKMAFMGFAYHPLNMDLLFPEKIDVPIADFQVFGTAYNLSKYDCDQIANQFHGHFNKLKMPTVLRNDLGCSEFFAQHTRGLALV